MNKLEEYRDKEADALLWDGCEVNNHCFDCGCPDLEDGYKRGFDAAIALDLPVKFAEWMLVNTEHKVGGIRVMKINKHHYFNSAKELYQYWLDNIYKP